MEELWSAVMRKCLQQAEILLDSETAPTADTVETVRGLVETAIMINKIEGDSPIGPGTAIRLKEI